MTTPIERAAQAMADDWNPDRDPILTAMFRDYAASAMDSIDVEQLRDVIAGWPIGTGYYGTQIGTDEANETALTIKNWLIGKDQQ